jgi:topoisomerase-4 subunit A
LPPAPLPGENIDSLTAVLTQAGRLLLFPLADLKAMSKGKGLMLIDLGKADAVVGVTVCNGEALALSGISRGGKAVEQTLAPRDQAAFRGTRARRGTEIPFRLKPTGIATVAKDSKAGA